MSKYDSFKGTKDIVLQPLSDKVPYSFRVTVCTSATTNDGYIPYNTSVTAAEVTAFDDEGNDVTAEMVDSTNLVSNIITVNLNYPSVSGEGNYSLRFELELSNGSTEEADFERICARNKGYG